MIKKIIKNTTVFIIAIVLVTPTFQKAIEKANAQGATCLKWTLYWTSTSKKDKPVDGSSLTPPIKNPISKGDVGFSSSRPALPTGISATDATWKCEDSSGSAKSPETEKTGQGMELCVQATKIATKYGGYTSLNGIDFDLKNQVKSFLEKEIGDALKIPSFSLDISTYIEEGKKFLSDQFKSIFKNTVQDSVAKEVDKIKEEAKKKLEEHAKDFIKNTAENIAGGALEGVLGGLSGASAVPTKESGALLDETKKINEGIKEQIAEQKHQIVIEENKDKCSRLYKSTVESIKRSILYQLSTQITDWIVNDEKPQFIKNPGKFAEDTAKLAVDRMISRVAPRLCEPFRLQVTAQIPSVSRETNPFYEQVSCTLDQVTSNIENFYSDFRDGGWIAYQELWKPQNNYYGAMMLVEEEANRQAAASYQAVQEDLNRGDGFKSQRRCTEWMLYKPVDCSTVSGKIVSSMKKTLRIDPSSGICYDEDKIFEGDIEDLPEDGSAPEVPADATEGSYWDCTKEEITIPGSVTADLGKKSQQTEMEFAAQSDDIENFMDTIEKAIINKLTKSGVKGLKNLLKGLPELRL